MSNGSRSTFGRILTGKYLTKDPVGARRADSEGSSLNKDLLTTQTLSRVRNLNAIAEQRDQTLAQMAIAWSLRDPRVTSALLGARSPEQLDDSFGAFNNSVFSPDELMQIDRHAIDTPDIDLWRSVSSRDE
jgi:L-glyceraldehyde 3-phosphate reductase